MFSVGTGVEEKRHAWVEARLKELSAGGRLLDAGAGAQVYRKFCGHLKYVSQDFGEYTGTDNAPGLHPPGWSYGKLDIQCDITRIPEPDASFDAILCTEVLEHLPDPVPALQELSRLVKPGGVLLLTAPFASLTHFAPYHFCTGFNRFFYETHLPRLGMEIEEMTANGTYFDPVAQELRRCRHVSKSMLGVRASIIDCIGIVLALRFLERCARRDTKSQELGCYGYHVRARKKA